MPKMVAFPGNEFGELPEQPSAPFNPQQIFHAKLRILRRYKDTLRFGLSIVPTSTVNVAKIEQYAMDVAGQEGLIPSGRPPKTPYDIGLDRQSWVLVELDSELKNWQFTPGFVGCTTKDAANGDDFGLRHVYPTSVEPGPIARDGCRVLFFGMAKRKKGASRYFNLHVEFLQKNPNDPANPHRLQVIFDPDVKNEGGFDVP